MSPGRPPSMMEIDTAGAAFLAGLVTGLHCVGMCGPLSCLVCGGSPRGILAPLAAYHGGRLLSYTALGTLFGWIGASVMGAFSLPAGGLFGWLLVAALLIMALGWDPAAHLPSGLAGRVSAARATLLRFPPLRRALLLGATTPLLPCGPLYLMLALALASGSPATGGQFMGAFAAGTLPLLALGQSGFGWLMGRLSPLALQRTRRGLALAAAVLVALRIGFGPAIAPGPETAGDCPLCP